MYKDLNTYNKAIKMGSKATIIITSVKVCKACNLYNHGIDVHGNRVMDITMRDKLIGELHKMPEISVVEVELSIMDPLIVRKETVSYHPQLYKFLNWFPTISLVNSSFNDRKAELQGVIYSSQMVNGKLTAKGGLNLFEPKLVTNWIRQELKLNPIFNLSENAPPPVRSTLVGSLPIPASASGSGMLAIKQSSQRFVVGEPTTDDEEDEDEGFDMVGF
jgi:hypothetical protein